MSIVLLKGPEDINGLTVPVSLVELPSLKIENVTADGNRYCTSSRDNSKNTKAAYKYRKQSCFEARSGTLAVEFVHEYEL
jgi:hypothetical protein